MTDKLSDAREHIRKLENRIAELSDENERLKTLLGERVTSELLTDEEKKVARDEAVLSNTPCSP